MRVTSIRTLNGKCNQKANQSSNVHIRACLLKGSLSKPMIATNGKAFPFLNCVAPGAHDGLLVALNFRFIKFSGALIYATLISILLPQIPDTPPSWHQWKTPVGRFTLRLTPFVPLGKEPQPKFPFQIILFHSVSVVSPTSVSCERRVNFLHYEMLRSLSR